MTTAHESVLERALTIRLNLQISLSALPIVEEWMDLPLTRWMESIPLPPELPTGHEAHFSVDVASDLSRLGWRAHGHPAGFVPKMADYLRTSGMSPQDTALLDAMGNTLEPRLVGSWVGVEAGQLITGWQFCDEHPFSVFEPFFGDHEAKAALMAWIADAGVERVTRFVQTVGKEASSRVELAVPGVAIDDQLDAVSRAFATLTGAPLPGHAVDAMSAAPAPGFAVRVGIHGGRIVDVAAVSPGLGDDMIAALCAGDGIALDDKHVKLQAAFGADGVERVVYTRPAGAPPRVDLGILPTGSQRTRPLQMN